MVFQSQPGHAVARWLSGMRELRPFFNDRRFVLPDEVGQAQVPPGRLCFARAVHVVLQVKMRLRNSKQRAADP